MARKKFSKTTYNLIRALGIFTVKLLGISWRYQRLSPQPKQKVIYAFWHRNILPLMFIHKNQDLVVMISQSQDGELISDACKALGYLTARGSSGKGGSKAVRDMIKLSKIHNLALTPDGPKGPPQTFKDGLVFVAKATKLPIVLVTADVSREVVFNSWDRFRLPLPFTKILVNYSQPFSVPRDADKMEVINSLTELMNKLEDETVITR